MGYAGRRPAPYFGPWQHRAEYLKKAREERRAEWEAKNPRPLRERVNDFAYIAPRKPVQVSPDSFAKSTQFRIHTYNVAQAVLRNREHFSDFVAREAEAFSSGATEVGFRKENGEQVQLVDRGQTILMADGNITPEEIRERYPQYVDFVRQARRELVNAVRKKGASIPLREIADFWDPRQRALVANFVKKNLKEMEALLPNAGHAEKAPIEALMLPFGSKKSVLNVQGGYYDRVPHDASLEGYRQGMAALESFSQALRARSALLEKGGLSGQAKRFLSAYAALKKSLVA